MTATRSRRSAFAGLVLGLSALVAAVAGCGKRPTPLAPPEPPAVTVVKPTPRDYAPVKEFTGRLATKDPVQVVPQVTGTIKARKFKDGEMVEQGKTVLYEIDPVLFDADLKKAIADAKKADADLMKAEFDIKNGKAQLAIDTDTRDRLKATAKGGAGSQTDLNNAEAKVVADQTQIDAATANKELAKANKEAAAAAEIKARQNLEYCTIKAPATGIVRRSQVAENAVVTQYQTVLTEVDPVDPIDAFFDVDELTSLWYRDQIRSGALDDPRNPNTPIRCWITLKNGRTFPPLDQPGVPLNYVDPEIVRGTGTRTIRATFPNPPVQQPGAAGLPAALRELSAGDSVRVRVASGRSRKVIAIPERVVMSSTRVKYVYVLTAEDEAQARQIELGPTFEVEEATPGGKMVVRYQAIDAGLTPEDRVVASNLLRVRPGVKVRIQ